MLPIEQLKDFVVKEKLFSKEDRILLAVSGGRDSVLMLHLFKLLGQEVGVAHVNFGLRGDESTRDEDFVKNLATHLNLPFFTTKFDTKAYAKEHKISTQMAARDLRYQWFEEIRSRAHYDFIALAQHKNDAVETMLINLLRGTGLSGMHGILPKRDKLIRPLLFLSRAEITNLVEDNNLAYVEDSSNLSNDYVRNKIRLEIIPRMQEINPKMEDTFVENAARFAEVEKFLTIRIDEIRNEIIQQKVDGVYISLISIKALKPISLLLFELLKPQNFTASVVKEIISGLSSSPGKQFFSATHRAVIDREFLIVTPIQQPVDSQLIYAETKTVKFGKLQLHLEFTTENTFEAIANKAYCDAEKLLYPLLVRRWQRGDKFFPIGMKTSKKLSDFFVDKKISLDQKETTPLIINGNGDIIWAAGMRQDNRYKVSPSTKKVAIFEIK